MTRRRKTAGTRNEGVSWLFLLASRTLLTLFAVLLFATPWTEGYRLLDNFPTGQDSELNLLALLAFLGLVLLIIRSARRRLRSLLWRDWFSLLLRARSVFQQTVYAHCSILFESPPLLSANPGAFNAPLQI